MLTCDCGTRPDQPTHTPGRHSPKTATGRKDCLMRIVRLHTGYLTAAPTCGGGPRPGDDLTETPERQAEPASYPALREHAAAAALAAGALGITAPHDSWTGMSTGQATTVLPDGTRLLYTPRATRTAGPVLEAYRRCRHGGWHVRPLPGPEHLGPFAAAVALCNTHLAGPAPIPAHKAA